MTDNPDTPAPAPPARKAAGDAAFSVSERVVSQIGQFAVFVLAARVLEPAEFGVFALASAAAIMLLRAAEAGWAPFIMSCKGDITVPLQVLFVAIVFGLICGMLGWLGALMAGGFGLSTEIVNLMTLFALWVAVANAASAQKGVLIFLGRIKTASVNEIAGELAGLTAAILALLDGAGVFALVYGRLAAQTTVLILGLIATRRLPLPGLERDVQRALWTFSVQIFSSRMLVNARLHFVTLIIGGVLGPAAVGYFRAAERLVGGVSELIVVPGQLLAWAQLRQARDGGSQAGQGARLNAQIARSLKVLVALGAPLLIWLALMNDQIVSGLLGENWHPASAVISILVLGRLFMFVGVLTEPLMSLTGQARRLPGFMTAIFAGSVALTLATAPYGITALAWSQVAVSALVLGATIWLFRRYAGVRWQPIGTMLRPSVLPLAAFSGTIWVFERSTAGASLGNVGEAIAAGLTAGAIYTLVISVFDPAFRRQMLSIFRPAPIIGAGSQ